MNSKQFYFKLSMALYLICLIVPYKGELFGGFFLFLFSLLGLLMFLVKLPAATFIDKSVLEIFSGVIYLLPLFNIIYIYVMCKFKSLKVNRFSIPQVILYICTIVGSFCLILLYHNTEYTLSTLYAFHIWLLSLLSLCIANLFFNENT